jgi:Zn-finger nucleic acid-binding protein
MAAQAPKCLHCGFMAAAPAPAPAHATVACPACAAPSTVANLGAIELDLCTGCSGVWFDRTETQALTGVLSNDQLGEDLEALLGALYKGSERTGKVYLSCPVCNAQMSRRMHKVDSNIQICRCEAHGVWVDRVSATRLTRLMRGEADAELRALEAKHWPDAQPAAELDVATRVQLVLTVFGLK